MQTMGGDWTNSLASSFTSSREKSVGQNRKASVRLSETVGGMGSLWDAGPEIYIYLFTTFVSCLSPS